MQSCRKFYAKVQNLNTERERERERERVQKLMESVR